MNDPKKPKPRDPKKPNDAEPPESGSEGKPKTGGKKPKPWGLAPRTGQRHANPFHRKK